MRQGDTDVVEDRRQRHVLLAAFTLAVAAQIEAQTRDSDVSQTVRQAFEEAALLTSDATTMDKDNCMTHCHCRRDDRAPEFEAVKSPEGCLNAGSDHVGSCSSSTAIIIAG
ncbi:hypothetical protein GCM10018963_63330 [Saccharothrix longispora]